MTGFSQVEETPYFGNMVIKMSLRMGSIPTVKNDGWTAVFNMGNQQGPTVKHRELCSMLCGSLDGRELWGRMDTCICMTESLSYHCLSAIPQYKIKSFFFFLSMSVGMRNGLLN